MMLFRGDYRSFFGQTGRVPGFLLILVIQAILGPFGSIPRLITLSFATLKPYLPESFTLLTFSIAACILVFLLTIKRRRIIDILGLWLCPVLLVSLGAILIRGFINPPTAEVVAMSTQSAFLSGLNVGYNTLDLIASFIFAPLVLSYFCSEGEAIITPTVQKQVFKKMIKACSLAAVLLAGMYIGLTYVASFYTPYLPPHAPEERLAVISMHLLGSKGAFFSCIAVALSCLTTAIPIAAISADLIHNDLMKKKGSLYLASFIALGLSALIANMGFMGIAAMLSPMLQILCPGLIILSILNIMHKLYEMRIRRVPVYAAFALSTIGYFIR